MIFPAWWVPCKVKLCPSWLFYIILHYELHVTYMEIFIEAILWREVGYQDIPVVSHNWLDAL
jgi:hypothetical protein